MANIVHHYHDHHHHHHYPHQVLAVRDKLPDLRAIIQYGEEDVDHDGVLSWEDFQVEFDVMVTSIMIKLNLQI